MDIDCYYLKVNITVNNLATCLIFVRYHIYDFSNCLRKIFFKFFFYSNLYCCFLVSIYFCLICKLVLILSITKSLFTFFSVLQKKFITWLTKTKWQNREIVLWFVQHPFGKANPYSLFQDLAHFVIIFYICYNFYFYIFKNSIDIIIFIDILLSLIGALFKYLILSYFTLLRYLFLLYFKITTPFNND